MGAHALLEFAQVDFRYPNAGIGLDQCSLSIACHSRNALLGANGAGKTTLFQHANALLRPQAGTILYAGEAIDYSRAGLHQLRSQVGLIFQNPDQQLFSASVEEDVSFGPLNLGLEMTEVRQRVSDALATVGMSEFADRPVHHLSFGQKKRVCIAGVLAMQPQLLILDEPMAGLDYAMRQELLTVLDDLHQQGITLLLATHDIDFAYTWADHIHLMRAGACTASFQAEHLAFDSIAQCALQSAGLPLPSVIELQHALQGRGLLSAEARPRDHKALLALLETSHLKEHVA